MSAAEPFDGGYP